MSSAVRARLPAGRYRDRAVVVGAAVIGRRRVVAIRLFGLCFRIAAAGSLKSLGENAGQGLIDARFVGPFGLTSLGIAQRVVQILRGRQQIRMGEHAIAGFGAALRLEVREERGSIAEATGVELEAHKG